MSECRYRIEGTCANEKAGIAFATRPSLGVCRICDQYDGPPRGAGDVVHSITSTTGIAKAVDWMIGGGCGGCAARRAALNAAVPFSDTPKKE